MVKPLKPRKGLSLDQIVKWAPLEPDIKNSEYVHLKKVVNRSTPDFPVLLSQTLTTIPNERPRKHYQKVWPADPSYRGKISTCPAIKVQCDCERHKFQWEVALYHHGATDIRFSNGEYPSTTNPRLVGAPCKHLYVVLTFLKRSKV